MSKPSLPQGTRDFGAEVVRKRNFILDTIKKVFTLYGFGPLETPAMENLDTLMGKYGDEGDKLIFKILNNGLDHPGKSEAARKDFELVLQGKNTKAITERALRYDLTIPFARYVAMNAGSLTLPFKRYQAQPVWRADRPQKGRYREFYQCDADIVGSTSLWNEAELIHIYKQAFNDLNIKGIDIRINSRKILSALAELCGDKNMLTPITVAIDKLDKIGLEKVKEELVSKNINEDSIKKIEAFLSINGNNDEKLDALKNLLGHLNDGKKGIEEIEFLLNVLKHHSPLNEKDQEINVDLTLARGLNYYTGIIIEVKAPETVKIGSIGGGGRYDDLTGSFGVKGIAGVGISFGIDRIYDVMEELNLFPKDIYSERGILFFNLGEAECRKSFFLLQQLRQKGIRGEIYHEQAKMDKQFKYAQKKQIPYVAIIGSKELEQELCTIKDLESGEQKVFNLNEAVEDIFYLINNRE